MFCDPLDIPDDIIAAQEAGELVVFVGAGVSCGGASDLPLFDGLTDLVGAKIGKTRDTTRKDFDALLGEWQDSHGARVHDAAHTIISNPQSRPNEAHRLLLRLFKKPEHVRIVTTNYDRHFTTAATEQGLKLPVYRAPALPLGDDFQGIVFLHGSVEDKPENLVLTDADFGRAYLSQGWARTFLQALYARFHVLFIGYSHGDILLSYLARGLPARDRHKRHAIQAQDDFNRWRQLGIGVIPYERPHSNLDKGLARWVQLSAYQPQDIRDRIRQIIDGVENPALVLGSETTPSSDRASPAIQLNRDSEDILARAFRDPVSTAWFTERAHDLRWITWLHDFKHLPLLSAQDSLSGLTGVHGQLIGWAVERLLAEPSADALALFSTLGGAFGPSSWWWAVRTLVVNETSAAIWNSPHLDHWLVAIRHGCGLRLIHSLLPELIRILVSKDKGEHALGLFNKLLQVRVEWTRPWAGKQTARPVVPEAKIAAENRDLREAWTALQSLRDSSTDDRLFRMLVTCIEEIYAASGPSDGRLDPVAGMRFVIDKPRGIYDPHDAEDFVPLMLVDLIKSRATSPGGIGEAQILRWLAAPQVGWHRFAYYALRMDVAIPAPRKAEIIVAHGLIYPKNWQLQHDPEALTSAIYGDLDLPTKRQIIEIVAAGPSLPKREDRTPEQIAESERNIRDGFLNRMAFAHASDTEIAATFNRLGLKLPEASAGSVGVEPEEIKVGFVKDADRSPLTVKELLDQTPETQIQFFLDYPGEGRPWSGPNRDGLHAAIVAAANENIDWARSLISGLVARGVTQGELWDRLVWGLNWHTKEPSFRRWLLLEVMPLVSPTDWTLGSWNGWLHHLFRVSDQKILKELSPEEWEALIEWSLRAWHATRSMGTGEDKPLEIEEAPSRAINHPIGQIVDFWLTYVSHQRQVDSSTPLGWPDRLQPPVSELMALDDDVRLLAVSVLGQNLSFIRYAFPDWTRNEIYPLLDVSRHSRLGGCLWTSWLHYGRLSAELAADLPPFFEQTCSHFLTSKEETPNRFLSYIAVLAAGPILPPETLSWLRTILSSATPAQRGWWISEVARILKDAPADRQIEVWQAWAKSHLESCRLGAFGAVTAEEFAEFLHWPVSFSALGDEVLSEVQRLPAHHVKRLDMLYELKQAGLSKDKPDYTARFLRWLFETVQVERYGYFGLDDVIKDFVVTKTNHTDLTTLANRLLALGCTKESDALFAKVRAHH